MLMQIYILIKQSIVYGNCYFVEKVWLKDKENEKFA